MVNSYNTGAVTGETYVGGLVGYTFSGSITDSYSYGPVHGNENVHAFVGYVYTNETVVYVSAYYLGSEEDGVDGTEAKSEAQFASGEVAYLLNTDNYNSTWGQNIDNDAEKQAYPVLNGAQVYRGYNTCDEAVDAIYTNSSHAASERPEHTPGEAVKENETASSYESVVYCSVCGAELSREVVSTGPVADSELKIANIGLSLQDYIGVQVAVRKADINGGVYDRAYLTFTQTSPEGEVTTGTSEFNLALGSYVGAEVPVMAWSMSDEVTVTVYYTVGGVTYVGESRTTSVRDQAMTRINTTSTSSSAVKNRNVCVAMLNYGAAVQTAFNHCSSNAEYLANYYLTADQKALPEAEFGGSVTLPSGSLKPARGALSFGAKVMMQFPIKNADLSNYVVRYSIDGGAEITVPKEDIMTQGSYVGPSIAAKPLYMRSEYRIAIYDATTGEKVYGDIVCSISALAAAHEGGVYHNVAVTMMAYGDAVAAL